MSCVLRVYGPGLKLDKYIADKDLHVCCEIRKGEPVTHASSRLCDEDGLHCLVSGSDELDQQVIESVTFLTKNENAINEMQMDRDISCVFLLDFGVFSENISIQRKIFPKELIQKAGSLGLEINLTIYP